MPFLSEGFKRILVNCSRLFQQVLWTLTIQWDRSAPQSGSHVTNTYPFSDPLMLATWGWEFLYGCWKVFLYQNRTETYTNTRLANSFRYLLGGFTS